MWHDIKLLNATSNALTGLAMVLLLSAGLWWVSQRPMFALRVIQIEGMEQPLRHVNALTVKSAALPQLRGNFFTADLAAVKAAFESVAWVGKAAVRREWPNSLIVSIEEHQPLGTWGEKGRLLSAQGNLFTANLAEAEEHGELGEFYGPEGSEKDVVQRYRQFGEWFAPVGLKPESVSLSSRYAWKVRMSNGMTVEFGREQTASMLQERVTRLVNVYPQLVQRLQDRIEGVDLRYPNGLALKISGMKFEVNGKKK